jgi:hypothetical protein
MWEACSCQSNVLMATVYCVRIAQSQCYEWEISCLSSGENLPQKSNVRSLYPFIHKDGTLHVGGRLENSLLPFDAKHQFIIPSSHRLAICDAHIKTMHGGAQLTMSVVRENFWVPSLKRKVKGLIPASHVFAREENFLNSSWVNFLSLESKLLLHVLM